jgi:hypothetical protein
MPIPFDCKWPAKVLQDLFKPRGLPDPDFKPFDLEALRAEDPSDLKRSTHLPMTKRGSSASERVK